MILDGVYYPGVIHLGRVILYVWSSPLVVSLSQRVSCYVYEYFHPETSIDVSCVFPHAMLIISPSHHLFKTCSPNRWQGRINTLVISTSRVTLTCHGTGAKLSLRAMAPSPSKKDLGLINPR